MKLNLKMLGTLFAVGAIGAIGLLALTPIWMLMQMGGRIPFTMPWLVVFLPLVGLMMTVIPVGSYRGSAIYAVAFALPMALTCFLMSGTDSRLRTFQQELYGDGIATLVLTQIAFLCATFQRGSFDSEDGDT